MTPMKIVASVAVVNCPDVTVNDLKNARISERPKSSSTWLRNTAAAAAQQDRLLDRVIPSK